MPDVKPWEKYAQQAPAGSAEHGPWEKYADSSSSPAPVAPPPGASGMGESVWSRMGSELMSGAEDVGAGALRGLLHTSTALSPYINKIPYIGEKLAPSSGIKAAEILSKPTNPAEKMGYTGEQIGEWLIPSGAEEKAGLYAAKMLPKLGKAAPVLGRITAGALETGVRNKMQGGEFGSGAEMGAGTGVFGEAARAVAPRLAESALGITQRMRGRGRTIGEAALGEIKGVRPKTITANAGEKIGKLTDEMEANVYNTWPRGVPPRAPRHVLYQQGQLASTQPAHDVLNEAIKNAPRNARELRGKLESLREVLSLDLGSPGQAPRMIHSPDELLEIKRGVDKTIQTWGPEWQKLPDVQRVKQQIYGALGREIDRLTPGNAELNQRISSLIPVKQAAKKLMTAAPLTQRLGDRMLAHTGALAGAGFGGAAGYKEYGIPGAIAGGAAGLILPELVASPSTQMWAARRLASPTPMRAARAVIGTKLMKRKDQSKSASQ